MVGQMALLSQISCSPASISLSSSQIQLECWEVQMSKQLPLLLKSMIWSKNISVSNDGVILKVWTSTVKLMTKWLSVCIRYFQTQYPLESILYSVLSYLFKKRMLTIVVISTHIFCIFSNFQRPVSIIFKFNYSLKQR